MAAVIDYVLWLFYKPMDFNIGVIGNDNEIFLSHWREKAYNLIESEENAAWM